MWNIRIIISIAGMSVTGLLLTGCQISAIEKNPPNTPLQQPSIVPLTPSPSAIPLPKTVIAVPVPETVLPKVITPDVVETIIKDLTPPKTVINGNIAPEIETITPDYLASYHWKLVKATDSDNHVILPLMDKNIKPTLAISANLDKTNYSLYTSVGCNSIQGKLNLLNNVLITKNLMATEMLCSSPLNKAESQLSSLMYGTSQLSLKKGDIPFLTQITDNDITLIWQGTQTARSRYSQKYAQEPDIVFLAIAPDTKFCDDQTTRQCLQIKPITYVDNKKVVTGDWLLLDGTIEGFTHNSELAQVIRVERYTVSTDLTKPKSYAYVLSQVIESAVVDKK